MSEVADRQILVPFLDFQLGDFELTPIPPEYFLDFSYTRTVRNASNEFVITVYDQTALEMGFRIAQGMDDVSFSYGWFGGDGEIRSPTYNAIIMDYESDFEAGGATLSITGFTVGVKSQGKPREKAYRVDEDSDEGLKIHEIVEEVAEMEGWEIGHIEPTAPVYKKEGTETEEEVHKVFKQSNQTSVSFLRSLEEYAMTEENEEGGYRLWFEDHTSPPTINFAPPDYLEDPYEEYEFEWNSPEGNVRDFNPRFSGLIRAIATSNSNTEIKAVEETSNDMLKEEYDDDSNPDKQLSGFKDKDYSEYKNTLDVSSVSKDEAKGKEVANFFTSMSEAYEAELIVDGDPYLEAYNTITVIPYVWGEPHHTAGDYKIFEIEDTIGGGDFETTCTLMKNASREGERTKPGDDVVSHPTAADEPIMT